MEHFSVVKSTIQPGKLTCEVTKHTLQELAGLGLLTYSCSSSCSSVHLFICSSVHLFIFLILTGVPAEGLGRGAADQGVCVPKSQTQSPFTGQFGHFCGPIGRGKHHPYLPIHLLNVEGEAFFIHSLPIHLLKQTPENMAR